MSTPKPTYSRSINGQIEYNLFLKEDPSKKLLVVFHGLGGNCTSPKYLFNSPRNSCNILGISLPFHTAKAFSYQTDIQYDHQAYIASVNELILQISKQLDTNQTIIMGHSIGALFSFHLFFLNPRAGNNLVLLCPAGFGIKDQRFFSFLNTSIAKTIFQFPGIRSFISSFIYKTSDPAKRKQASSAIGLLLKEVSRFDLIFTKKMHLLYTIGVDVKIIWAKDDPLLPFNYAAECGNHFQRSSIKLLQYGGHNLLKTRPDEINNIVQGILN